MLYSKEYITKSILIGIWKIEESKDELFSLLQHREWVEHVFSIKSESRILEMLAARVLIRELIGEEKEIYYNNTGKPFLTDKSFHISVSHTKGYVAVVANKDNEIGLDIECISEKIRRVRSRIISDSEYIDEEDELVHLLLHWSAKEAMFKFMDVEGVDFLHHLFVEKFIPDSRGVFKTLEKRTKKNLHFNAYYKVEKDFVLVCLESE